jgi:ribA/ribD-fused uncharacterized protein
MSDKIDEFMGKYRFLSNFWMADVHYDGITYPSTEHAFQAMKTMDIKKREEISKLKTPGEAKKAGKTAQLRDNWENIKYGIMYDLVLLKFVLHDDLRKKLLATDESELIEGNNWGDKVWGVCNGEGQNKLGRILMEVRGLLR